MSQPRKSGSTSPQINRNMAQFYPSTNVNNTVPTNPTYSPTNAYSHMPHYAQMEPARAVTVYPLPSAQWQYPPAPPHSFQREMGTAQYPVNGVYQPVEQLPQGAVHYPTATWTDSSPIEDHPSPTMQHPDYFYRRQTSPRGARAESGPSRTSRSSRRTPSLQDATGMMTPSEGASGEVAEAAAGSLSKRPKQAHSGTTTNDAKGFACDLCSATFTRKGDCLRHRRSVHTRETPYDCQGCGDQFSRSDMRGKHWKAEPECETVHWREVCKAMGHANLVDQ